MINKARSEKSKLSNGLGVSEQTSDDEIDMNIEDNQLEKPLLVVKDAVLFPRMLSPVSVLRESEVKAVEAAARHDEELIVVTQSDLRQEEPSPDNVYQIGIRAAVVRHLSLPQGGANVLLQGYERIEILEWVQLEPYPIVRVRRYLDEDDERMVSSTTLKAQMRTVQTLFERYANLQSHIPDEALSAVANINSAGWMADFIATVIDVGLEQQQSILELIKPEARLMRLSVLLARELDVLELEDRIHNRVQQSIDKSQREYFLREQIRVMQSELGEGDGLFDEIGELQQQLDSLLLPDEVRTKAQKELNRLASMPFMAPETAVIRTYLDWILELPWVEQSEAVFDVDKAEEILNENHYGLPRVKERILEYIAVRSRIGESGHIRTPILCFVGPPGTGKTSLGRSIAEALGRKFARLSLGGIRDEAEIRGHRRTYIGAMPGRIIQTMKRVGTINPLIMLDEIDKVGADYRGDPTAALLEVLDPEQNYAFSDHYLDLPFDLSKVLFITTANIRDTIPPALADRMETIEFAGYIDQEKLAIAKQFLIRRHLDEHALSPTELSFTDKAIQYIMHNYTYESGVRNLDRELGRVCRKVVRRLGQGKRTSRTITPKLVPRYLGVPKRRNQFLDREDEVGIATGLSWTSAGGDALLVEVSLHAGTGNLTITGQLGSVMKESVEAALSYAKACTADYEIDAACFDTTDIHIHVPEGAIPKDGPSAGITMATALISAFSGKKVRHDVAMTGEMTLRGRVLAIGGLRVKAIAAHRAGIKTVIIPRQNQPDLEEIPKSVKDQINFVLADRMDTVLEASLID